jgi:hypothetical protein
MLRTPAASLPTPVPATKPAETATYGIITLLLDGSSGMTDDMLKLVQQTRPQHIAAGIVPKLPNGDVVVVLYGEYEEIDQMVEKLGAAADLANASSERKMAIGVDGYKDKSPLPKITNITGEPTDRGGQLVWRSGSSESVKELFGKYAALAASEAQAGPVTAQAP